MHLFCFVSFVWIHICMVFILNFGACVYECVGIMIRGEKWNVLVAECGKKQQYQRVIRRKRFDGMKTVREQERTSQTVYKRKQLTHTTAHLTYRHWVACYRDITRIRVVGCLIVVGCSTCRISHRLKAWARENFEFKIQRQRKQRESERESHTILKSVHLWRWIRSERQYEHTKSQRQRIWEHQAASNRLICVSLSVRRCVFCHFSVSLSLSVYLVLLLLLLLFILEFLCFFVSLSEHCVRFMHWIRCI